MSGGDGIQAVVFGLDQEVFAVTVGLVREILDHREAFRMPQAPDWLTGLTDVRGTSVPMVDLRLRLGMAPAAPTAHTRILVVEALLGDTTLTLGLVVDRVIEVATFRHDEIGAAPDIGMQWRSDYIAGVVRRDDGFVVHLDLPAIFADGGDRSLLAAAA